MRQRFSTVFRVLFSNGTSGVIKLIKSYFLYQLKEKWEFVYFETKVEKTPYKLPNLDKSIVIRMAVKVDITQIKNDIYPFLTEKQENDKRYIEAIGSSNVKCFLAEKDNKLIHYSLLFENALNSPLIQTPIIKRKINSRDAYLGSVFTIPDSRGLWIVPHSILNIFSYLHKKTDTKRILAIVHKDTPGAEIFYKRLGFNEMKKVTVRNYLHIFRNK
jgi:ribosomal protein S18 acetylase RimI-like enzyme